ncbi:hypothetical protein QN277_013307 [Acacia crassicarpa]|uniref:Uncharacterized protein n=1 Tax=Acacia crassicarpa TaxID=499986 RepID=A0AAE1N3E5_9FABA|nr:hypothetical protein QN277_013307 [Acacia crassicarpa]
MSRFLEDSIIKINDQSENPREFTARGSRNVRKSLPGWADKGIEDARDSKSHARIGSKGVDGGLPQEVFDGLNEEIEASDRRDVKGERHGGEGNGEQ